MTGISSKSNQIQYLNCICVVLNTFGWLLGLNKKSTTFYWLGKWWAGDILLAGVVESIQPIGQFICSYLLLRVRYLLKWNSFSSSRVWYRV